MAKPKIPLYKIKMPTSLAELANRLVLKDIPLPYFKSRLKVVPLVEWVDTQLFKAHQRQALLLPNLRDDNSSVGVYSDYSGERSSDICNTYSFLVCGDPGYFWKTMKGVRDKYFSQHQTKEYAYKDLGFGPVSRSLDDYLQALDLLPGLLFTLAIDKNVGNLFNIEGDPDIHVKEVIRNMGYGSYRNKKDAEKMLIIVHVAAYLVSLLSWKKQKVFWMTDHDSIVPNVEQHKNILRLFQAFLKRYSRYRYKLIGGATPFEERSTDFLDLLSATDLAAGAVARVFQRTAENSNETASDPAADKILRWIGRQGIGLKKFTMRVKRDGEDIHYVTIEFPSDKPHDAQEIRISV